MKNEKDRTFETRSRMLQGNNHNEGGGPGNGEGMESRVNLVVIVINNQEIRVWQRTKRF